MGLSPPISVILIIGRMNLAFTALLDPFLTSACSLHRLTITCLCPLVVAAWSLQGESILARWFGCPSKQKHFIRQLAILNSLGKVVSSVRIACSAYQVLSIISINKHSLKGFPCNISCIYEEESLPLGQVHLVLSMGALNYGNKVTNLS